MEANEFTFDVLTEDTQSDENNSLFGEENTSSEEEEDKGKDEKDKDTADVNPNEIFLEEQESVGSEENDTSQEGSTSNKKGSSPSVYSSIANALKEDGVLDLDDEDLKDVNEAEDFANLIQKQVDKRLDETLQRIKDALDNGVEPSEVRSYELTINYLDSITEENISDETEQGENLRKQLIYQDFINRGFSEERATKEVEKSINSGTDLEDAKEALTSNTEFFKKSYEDSITESKKITHQQEESIKREVEKLKKVIIETEEPFDGVKIDKIQRNKIYDTLTKPVFKTDEGKMLTAILKFELDNPVEFKLKLATLFVLTDGFKKLDNVVKDKVKKETKKSLRELEHTIINTPAYSSGRIKLGNSTEDEQSHGRFKLDI